MKLKFVIRHNVLILLINFTNIITICLRGMCTFEGVLVNLCSIELHTMKALQYKEFSVHIEASFTLPRGRSPQPGWAPESAHALLNGENTLDQQ
jgi:hypothetical protein